MKFFKEIFLGKRRRFDRICSANNLKLNYSDNKSELDILINIFEGREYSDYFPFYMKTVIVDIGAHYGYFSLFSFLNAGKDSSIYAVEPEKNNFERLKKNISENSATNIIPLNFAIGGGNGVSKLFSGRAPNHSLLVGYPLSDMRGKSQETEVKTLERFMEDAHTGKIDFLKMDCEGAEYSILQNTPKNVFDCIQTVSMEFHDLKNQQCTGESIIGVLAANGFEIVKYSYGSTRMGLNFGKIIGTKVRNKK